MPPERQIVTTHYLPAQAPARVVEDLDAEPDADAVPYGILSQRNDDYDAELLEKIEDLYVGGFEIQRKAAKHLIRLEGETDAKFRERCRIASYIGFFSQIVDQFVADVFVQPLSVKPAADADNPNTPGELPDGEFYSEFLKNADRRGTSFVDLMKETLRAALKHRRALVVVDAPGTAGDPVPNSLADEDARGSRRLYAYETPVGRLIDWKIDDATGHYVWAVLYDRERTRESPWSAKGPVRESFTVWTIGERDGARAKWARYVLTHKPEDPPQPETLVRVEERGETTFARIPILKFELSSGLHVGNKVGPQACEHWQRRSALIGAQNRSLVAIPYVKRGPQAPEAGGAIPADIAADQARGSRPVSQFNSRGYLELDAEDDFGFAEPEGRCYALVDQQLEKLREMMFQVVFQMAASVQRNNTSMGRSGQSKQKDEDLTARVLRALGHVVREFGVELFNFLALARGEDVHWTPHGLDAYDSEDREALIEEAQGLDAVAEAIPSETFHIAHARSIAEKLLKGAVDVETLATIVEELSDGIRAKHEIMNLKRDAEKEQVLNPDPPDPVGGVPVPKTRTSKFKPEDGTRVPS